MKILYVTAFPDNYYYNIVQNYDISLSYASQKFNNTLIKGFKDIGIDIEVLCPHDLKVEFINKKTRLNWITLSENGITYNFCPTSSNKYIRKIIRFYALKKYIDRFFKRYNDGLIIMDSLSPCSNEIHKISRKTCHIVTDLSDNIDEHKKHSSLYSMLNEADYLVLMTEQMKSVINTSNAKGNIIIQGVVDHSINPSYSSKQKIILFSGTITETNGINNLIEAFQKLESDYELHLYGDGPYRKKLEVICKLNKKIKYFGPVSNDVIIQKQQEALILVNPRPINQSFTAYSFPSKLLEYMASGSATISTKLPCITEDFNEVLEYFDKDDVDGIYSGLKRLVTISNEQLIMIGKKQHDFVIKNKSNTIQARKILNMIESNNSCS